MRISIGLLALSCTFTPLYGQTDKKGDGQPAIEYDAARVHEVKSHRRSIPLKEIAQNEIQLRLQLVVSPTGDVMVAEASGEDTGMRLWPQLIGEVTQWHFTPFLVNGKPSQVEVEEYVDLVPAERLPKKHVLPPALGPKSKIIIRLERSGCMGSCPAYNVTLTNESIDFDGGGFVVAEGKHTAAIEQEGLVAFARRFEEADFYSMEPDYYASVTDCPGYFLSISIDGHEAKVRDYMGIWVGMPAIIAELEEEVDTFADTKRWIAGEEGLVDALRYEHYNFTTFAAQQMLKAVLIRDKIETARDLIDSGVPLKAMAAPKVAEKDSWRPFQHVGWLTAASNDADELQLLMAREAGKEDQMDKNLALDAAARGGNVAAARMLIAYGANAKVNLSQMRVPLFSGGMPGDEPGTASILISAADSGNPEMVKVLLKYKPNLEARDETGKTAMFAAGEFRSSDKSGARAECVKLLAEAGASVRARDEDGNTPLHETFLGEVEEELLRQGADVNARNDDGDTPIATTVDLEAYPLLLGHGADLNLIDKKGQTMAEAVRDKGPAYAEALDAVLARRK